ncbi:ester cyclase [Streptomyces iconiensis]|uniref:Ester cyclase n=1 Tax=Streptomyces iconiensis TaxID=1384038 RepID=A0ABT6ZVC4_9ACTN|nr:ester cyclase [Streptomyces iconiensis]MDJ1133020.1 ester cyclase [Streptomyces iconiensis]
MEHHNKAVARRFLEETEERNREPAYADLCTPDYVEHDPVMPRESVGRNEAAQVYGELLAAFELRHTAESVVAEGDLVCARFTVRGRHVGEYHGFPPSGRTFEGVPGQVTLRFQEGRIAEAWFNWYLRGLLEQLGAPPGSTL